MYRRIILLNNPGIPNVNYRPSVFSVQERYRNYFMSPMGGYWDNDDEIMEMPEDMNDIEQSVWLEETIKNLNLLADYSIIVFTGHGGAVINAGGVNECIQLSSGAFYPIQSLMPKAGKRRTIIIDACRCPISLNEAEIKKQEQLFERYYVNIDGVACRDYYNRLVMEAEPHYELAQSTQLGQEAYATLTGSAFSDALFATIKGNDATWKSAALGMENGEFSFDLERLIEMSKAQILAHGQVPQFTADSDERFPFYAVKRVRM